MKPIGLKRLQHPEGDYYPTPAPATKAIMEREDFPGVVWDRDYTGQPIISWII
jgi:hypothetical protein